MYLCIHIYFLNDIKNYIKRNNKEIYFSSDFIFRIINKFFKSNCNMYPIFVSFRLQRIVVYFLRIRFLLLLIFLSNLNSFLFHHNRTEYLQSIVCVCCNFFLIRMIKQEYIRMRWKIEICGIGLTQLW